MKKSISIGILITKKDKEIADWLNMLLKEEMNPRTWVQALLLTEIVGKPIDAGGVYIPQNVKPSSHNGTLMFGDDTEDDEMLSTTNQGRGRNCRGPNGEFVIGSVFTIRITRPIMLNAIEYLKDRNKKIAPYIKFSIRQQLRILPQGPNQPPNERDIQDIFIIYEDFFSKKKRKPQNKEAIAEKQLLTSKPKPVEITQLHQAGKPEKKKNPLLNYIT